MDYETTGGVMAPPEPPAIRAPEAGFFDSRRSCVPSRRGLVPRRRLVRRLIASRETPLVVVAAPAGYGKTSLLSEWAEVDERPFAWVTLDERDNDVGHMMMAIVRVLAEIDPIEAVMTSPLSSRVPCGEDLVLEQLARLLDGQRKPFVMVLDNAHVLEAPDALNALATIAGNLPAGSQLALSSRSLPDVHLGRLRAEHQLVELHGPDLAMTAPEAAMLLEAAGLPLDTDNVDALVRRAEGWPVALYLAALSLRDEPNVAGAVSCFDGDNELVSDYIREELIGRLAPEAVEFLLRSSILGQLSGSVCDAVLERSDSALMLSDLARHELLLLPLDRNGERYRCPGLLRAMLQRELGMHDHLGRVAELHRRASIWHAERGELDRAIDHAVAANDTERAADLLWTHLPAFVGQAHDRPVKSWLRSFTSKELAGDPALSLCAAHSYLAAGDLASAEHWGMAADAALRRSPDGPRVQSLRAGATLIGACVARHGMVRMGREAAKAYELESAQSPWRAVCRLYQGVAAQLTGDTVRARELLDDGLHRSATVMPRIETLCLAQLAFLDVADGDWEGAEDRSAQASAVIRRERIDDFPTSALVFALAALVSAQAGRADQAKESLREATQRLRELDGYGAWYGLETRIMLARAAARLTDMSRARTLLAEASRAARRLPDAPVVSVWLDQALGELDSRAAAALQDSSSLTLAELRILRFLPTHLSFREIGDRLHVSTNTVKSQAHAVYRKLGACSRSEAVARASRVGLIWSLSSSTDG
jgi:LuxR family transcriptional regulator, maltose regulon positive regulatory protein